MKESDEISRRDFVGLCAGAWIARKWEGNGSAAHGGAAAASLVLHGAPVLTADQANSVQGALALQGNRILGVARDLNGIQPFIGPGTQVLKLNQHSITAGMIDVHNHLVAQATTTIDWVDLLSCNTVEDVRNALARFVVQREWKEGQWVRGTGYCWLWDKLVDQRSAAASGQPQLLNRWDLDQTVKVSGRKIDLAKFPIYLVQISGHYASVNGLALTKAKITDGTGKFYTGSDARCLTVPGQDIGDAFSPERRAFGSFFHRADQRGTQQVSGVIFHHYAMEEFIVRAAKFGDFPELSSDELNTALRQRSREFIRMGVTSIYDNNLRSVRHLETVRKYAGSARPEDKLRLTLHPYICDLNKGAFPAYDQGGRKGIISRCPQFEGEWIRLIGYKLQVDAAAMTGFTWEPSRAFGSRNPGRLNLWEYADLLEIVKELDRRGAQVSVHVIGDKALDWTLDAFENAKVGGKDRRHRVEHLGVVPHESRNGLARKTVPLLERARDLGLVFCPQPGFIYYYANAWERAYGPGMGRMKSSEIFPRMTHSVPYRSAVEAGVRVALSSDNPCVANASPLLAIWESVHRRTMKQEYGGRLISESIEFNHPDAKGRVVDERVSFAQALRGHTIDAAYCGHEEKDKGSLEPGKLADLVVWNKDLRIIQENISVGKLDSLKPVLTVIDGRIVYQDPSAGIRMDKA